MSESNKTKIGTINICGIPHDVYEVHEMFDKGNILGEINYIKAEIFINGDTTPEQQREVLCHEIIQGIFFHIGRCDLGTDENIVQSLANAISQTFYVKNL